MNHQLKKMNKLNVAVIGAGAMGRSHARVYSSMPNARLVAVCDINKEMAESIASQYNTGQGYSSKCSIKFQVSSAISARVYHFLFVKSAVKRPSFLAHHI